MALRTAKTGPMPARPKGKGPGRPKGSPNKITSDIRAAIIGAFSEAGGQEYLLKVAKEDHKTFCALLGRVLPTQVTGADGGPIKHEVGADAAFSELASALGGVARGQASRAVVTSGVVEPSKAGTDNA